MWSFVNMLIRAIDASIGRLDVVGKYGAGKCRFGVTVRRDSRGTLCSCLFVIIPAANNAESRARGAETSPAPSMQVTSIHARSVS
jgi:hypothetical protein